MKSLSVFYFKNYKSIHHIVFITMVFSFLKFISLFVDSFDLIFQVSAFGLFLQLVILVSCYFINEKALIQAGLTPEHMAEELERVKSERQKKRGE